MTWINTKDKLPPDEMPVLCAVHGYDVPLILERRWEYPSYEDTFTAFWYWDEVVHDGQDFERDSVVAWTECPALPTFKDMERKDD